MDKPAIHGGKPMFEQRVNIVRPVLPRLETMAADIQGFLSTGMVTKGVHLKRFEEACAEHLGVKHAVGVSSCTSGLMLAYPALGLAGCEVLVPSFTFMASVSSMVWNQMTPVFVDIDYQSANVDPASLEAAITPRTRAIVAVHTFGNPAQVEALEALARKHNLKVVYDAAHGFGSLYQGKTLGRFGDVQAYSLSPSKLVIAGEGGIVATNSDEVAAYVRLGREYGNDGKYDSAFAGMNARLGEFNAVLGLASLSMLDQAVRRRNEYVEIYRQQLHQVPGLSFQSVAGGNRSSYKDFCLMVESERFGLSRDRLSEALQAENIDTRHYFDPAAHNQTAYRKFYTGQPLPQTARLEKEALSLPLWSEMDEGVIEKIARAIVRIHEHAVAARA
jgi:dTDP-4-amino-4,6-dideoxygalactose transaminase